MIVWCSYCQRFDGEKAPLDDLSLTHGICSSCRASGAVLRSPGNLVKARQIAAFYDELRLAVKSGKQIEVAQVVAKGKSELGLQALDLCVGILQPILYELGKLLEAGQLTVAREQMFVRFADELALSLSQETRPGSHANESEQANRIDIVLVCAEASLQGLELRAVAMTLKEAGYKAQLFYPGLPVSEILALVDLYKPRLLGIAISSEEQLPALLSLCQQLGKRPPNAKPKLMVCGSYAAKFAAEPLADVMVAPAKIEALLAMMPTILS